MGPRSVRYHIRVRVAGLPGSIFCRRLVSRRYASWAGHLRAGDVSRLADRFPKTPPSAFIRHSRLQSRREIPSQALSGQHIMKMKTKSGRLTPYALACGYVERRSSGSVETELWREHEVYHVRQHDHGEHRRVMWESFRLLADARRRFDEAKS